MSRLLAVALCVLLGAACIGTPVDVQPSSPSTTAVEPGGGTLRWALGADPTSLDPARIVTREDELVVDALFDSLTTLGPDLVPRPALAISWESDDDASLWRFDLDPAARWSNGDRVVADDVVRGFRRVADGTGVHPSLHAELLSAVAGYTLAQRGEPLEGIRAVDELTVEVRLVRPEPALPTIVAHPALAPVPPVATDEPAAFGESPVGNGPFSLAEDWVHSQFLRLVPSPAHPSPPLLDELVFRVYAGDGAGELRWADLVAGQVQVSEVPLARRDEVGAQLGVGALRDELIDVATVLLLATDQPPTDDVRVRRAVSLLIDRRGVAARTNGSRVVATSLVPPSLSDAPGGVCSWCRHDPDEAVSLITEALEEAARVAAETAEAAAAAGAAATVDDAVDGDATGATDEPVEGAEVQSSDEVGTPSDAGVEGDEPSETGPVDGDGAPEISPSPQPPVERPRIRIIAASDGVSRAIVEQMTVGLEAGGIDVIAEIVTPAVLPATVEAVDPHVVVTQWTGVVPTAESFLAGLVGPATVGREMTGWDDQTMFDLLLRIRSSSLLSDRARALRSLEILMLNQAVVVPLLHATGDLAVGPSVRGFVQAPDGSVDLTVLEVAPTP